MFTLPLTMKTCGAFAVLSILPIAAAQADIIAVSGSASFEGSVRYTDLTPGAYDQNKVVFGFNEHQCLEIDGDEYLVDYLINEGDIGTPLPGGGTPDPELTLPGADGYASHIIHFDPVSTRILRGQDASVLKATNATFEFDNDIVAVIVNSSSLVASDSEFGYASTTYSTGSSRGFEANDFFTINSLNTLTVNIVTSAAGRIDNMRVITANPDCD